MDKLHTGDYWLWMSLFNVSYTEKGYKVEVDKQTDQLVAVPQNKQFC